MSSDQSLGDTRLQVLKRWGGEIVVSNLQPESATAAIARSLDSPRRGRLFRASTFYPTKD